MANSETRRRPGFECVEETFLGEIRLGDKYHQRRGCPLGADVEPIDALRYKHVITARGERRAQWLAVRGIGKRNESEWLRRHPCTSALSVSLRCNGRVRGVKLASGERRPEGWREVPRALHALLRPLSP